MVELELILKVVSGLAVGTMVNVAIPGNRVKNIKKDTEEGNSCSVFKLFFSRRKMEQVF